MCTSIYTFVSAIYVPLVFPVDGVAVLSPVHNMTCGKDKSEILHYPIAKAQSPADRLALKCKPSFTLLDDRNNRQQYG